jgi:hypothetical protein
MIKLIPLVNMTLHSKRVLEFHLGNAVFLLECRPRMSLSGCSFQPVARWKSASIFAVGAVALRVRFGHHYGKFVNCSTTIVGLFLVAHIQEP